MAINFSAKPQNESQERILNSILAIRELEEKDLRMRMRMEKKVFLVYVFFFSLFWSSKIKLTTLTSLFYLALWFGWKERKKKCVDYFGCVGMLECRLL
jgi:hypothetical protein